MPAPAFFAASHRRPTHPSSDPSAACDAIASAAAPSLSRTLRNRSASLLRHLRAASSPSDLRLRLSTPPPPSASVVPALLPVLLANLLNAHP